MSVKIGKYCTVADDVKFGKNVIVHGHANLYGCTIGDESRIGTFVEIQRDAVIGKRVRVQSHSFICSYVVVEDDVFIGHNVTFINDPFPRATTKTGELQTEEDWECIPTLIRRGASIGSSATILSGVTIGENALVGAGAVVTKDVPENTIVAGNPARVIRKLNEKEKL